MRKAMLIALAVLFMTSCSALQMTVSDIKLDLYDSSHFDADTFKMAHPEKCGILLGTITNEQSTPGRVVVLAFPDAPVNTKASDRAALHDAGSYMLCVPAGRYRIVAFEDFNDNRICDQNEMVGRLESPEIVSVEEGMVIGGLDFTIGGQGSNFLDFPIDVKLPAAVIGGGKSLERGAVISLDEAVFARSYGSIGLWSPSRFIEEIGVQIYGLDRYDDSKIPVLFVHGSG
jgi:hypothetical protein